MPRSPPAAPCPRACACHPLQLGNSGVPAAPVASFLPDSPSRRLFVSPSRCCRSPFGQVRGGQGRPSAVPPRKWCPGGTCQRLRAGWPARSGCSRGGRHVSQNVSGAYQAASQAAAARPTSLQPRMSTWAGTLLTGRWACRGTRHLGGSMYGTRALARCVALGRCKGRAPLAEPHTLLAPCGHGDVHGMRLQQGCSRAWGCAGHGAGAATVIFGGPAGLGRRVPCQRRACMCLREPAAAALPALERRTGWRRGSGRLCRRCWATWLPRVGAQHAQHARQLHSMRGMDSRPGWWHGRHGNRYRGASSCLAQIWAAQPDHGVPACPLSPFPADQLIQHNTCARFMTDVELPEARFALPGSSHDGPAQHMPCPLSCPPHALPSPPRCLLCLAPPAPCDMRRRWQPAKDRAACGRTWATAGLPNWLSRRRAQGSERSPPARRMPLQARAFYSFQLFKQNVHTGGEGPASRGGLGWLGGAVHLSGIFVPAIPCSGLLRGTSPEHFASFEERPLHPTTTTTSRQFTPLRPLTASPHLQLPLGCRDGQQHICHAVCWPGQGGTNAVPCE